MPTDGFLSADNFDSRLPQLKNRVIVLLGGDSAEREISLQSGVAVSEALLAAGYPVIQVDPSRQKIAEFDWAVDDFAFLALHGTHGEDGTIQQQLDQLHICYTGSHAEASALAFHKRAAKERFLGNELLTPDFRTISIEMDDAAVQHHARELGYPLVVKPEAQGSSLGVSILTSPQQLASAVRVARELDELILLEKAIEGQEWTVPVLDDRALFPIRIGTPHQFFDFEAKYLDEETRYDVMMDLQDRIVLQVQQLSLAACQSLGCRGISRVDLRVDAAGRAWLLEVNTIPGMTQHSLVPKSALAAGWSMSRLCEEILFSAMRTKTQES